MQKSFPKTLKKPKIIIRSELEEYYSKNNKWWIYNRKRPQEEIERIALVRRLETIQAQSKELAQSKEQGRKAKTRLVKLPGGTYARIPDDY